MSQPPTPTGARRSRRELLGAFDRETRRLGSTAAQLSHAVADRLGVHPTDHECIQLLNWTGPLTAGEVGHHLGLSSGAVTALLDRLEAARWVRRERDPDDRRRVVVHLSDEHGDELAEVYAHLSEGIAAYRDGLDTAALRAIVEFLEFGNDRVGEATRRARR